MNATAEAKPIVNQPEYNQAVQQGEAAVRTLTSVDPRPMVERCPYLWSSNMADAWWIGAWSTYNAGKLPTAIRKSRGHSWRIMLNYLPYTVIVESPDHRNGVRVIGG